jgi:hypothetical protein
MRGWWLKEEEEKEKTEKNGDEEAQPLDQPFELPFLKKKLVGLSIIF